MSSASWIGWAALAAAVAANVGANLLLKHAVGRAGEGGGGILQNPPVLAAGIVLAGCLLGFYLVALRHLPVSLAYPVVTGTAMVGIAVFSALLFSEPLGAGKLAGIAGIVIGTVLVLRG